MERIIQISTVYSRAGVCRAKVWDSWKCKTATAKAGGYGYSKDSAAVEDAFMRWALSWRRSRPTVGTLNRNASRREESVWGRFSTPCAPTGSECTKSTRPMTSLFIFE